MSKETIDEVSGVATTGHIWDGIQELDNPMPRWWIWTFYATIVWAIGYAIAYPSWPLLTSATSGLLGFSSRADIKAELAAAEASKGEFVAAIKAKDIKDIIADEKLRVFATAAGAAAFKVNCVQCHGSGAQGAQGYPNLNDDDWLWGGSVEVILQTISHGIRFTADGDTRVSEMPAFKDVLQPEQVSDVVNFVTSLSGMPSDPARAAVGKQVFADNCAACHGDDGKGKRDVGAPNLTDAIILYVRTPDDISRQVRSPRHGVMPAWAERLGDVTVKELAVYVHSLGGGE